jgi:rhodanese-related sulfurtransferase
MERLHFANLSDRISCIAVAILLLAMATPSLAKSEAVEQHRSFNYISASDLMKRIEYGESLFLIDIQVEEEYAKHHLRGTFPTHAYPVKTDEEQAKLLPALKNIINTDNDVVIICPRGAGGAKRTYKYLNEKGVGEDRLLILKEGQSGWPYPEMLVNTVDNKGE